VLINSLTNQHGKHNLANSFIIGIKFVGFDRKTCLFRDTICRAIREALNLIFTKWHYIYYTVTLLWINFCEKYFREISVWFGHAMAKLHINRNGKFHAGIYDYLSRWKWVHVPALGLWDSYVVMIQFFTTQMTVILSRTWHYNAPP
jgi:hypothetical protein